MAVQRIGIFGGTFDPIHYTHLDVARVALTAANLDRVVFVVSARPPHKHDATQATPEQRLAMVEAALIHEPRMVASSVELRRSGPSYTYETLEHFAAEYPGAEFFLILGMDALKDLPKWKYPERILRRAHLLVVPRAEDNVEVPDSMKGKFTLLPFETSTVSSTDIRRRAASGEDLHDLVPPGTLRVMREERIYSAGA
jgi:nicotinate-nucleotide adenylyltransferase